MSAKKVLLSAYACSPMKGSEEGNGWSWATNLARLGYEVWCYTNVQDKEETIAAAAKLSYRNLHFVFVELGSFLDDKFLDPSSKKIYLHYLLWQKKAARVAARMHEKIRFDIGHHVTYGSLQQGHFLWKLKDIKIIFGPVGGGQKALPVLKEYFGNAWRTEQIRSLVSWWSTHNSRNFKNSIRKSDYVLVTNQDTLNMAGRVSNYSKDKIVYVLDTAVPQPIQDLPLQEKRPGKKLKILWVGRMLPRKGLNLILESLAHVPQRVNYSLTIVGGGERFAEIDGWIKRYGIDKEKLEILGQIPFVEVIEQYQKADVFIFCSLRDSYGAQLTEAMAFGLPVIVLNIHGASIGVPDDCGIKITPHTKESTVLDIAAAITKMHDDVPFRLQCGQNAIRNSNNNTWEKRVKNVTENFY